MYDKLQGHCEIRDYFTDTFISIEMKKLGHVCIRGQLGANDEDHLNFSFITDQTVLGSLIQIFRNSL